MKTRHEYSSTRVEFPPPYPPPGGLSRSNLCVRSCSRQFQVPSDVEVRGGAMLARPAPARGEKVEMYPGTSRQCADRGGTSIGDFGLLLLASGGLLGSGVVRCAACIYRFCSRKSLVYIYPSPTAEVVAEAGPSASPRRCTDVRAAGGLLRSTRSRAAAKAAAGRGPSERIRDAALLASCIQDDCINGRPDSTPTAAWVASGARLRSQCHSRH